MVMFSVVCRLKCLFKNALSIVCRVFLSLAYALDVLALARAGIRARAGAQFFVFYIAFSFDFTRFARESSLAGVRSE